MLPVRSFARRSMLLVLLLTSACGDRVAGTRGDVARTDSAGIEIVTSAAPAWGDADGWTVDPARPRAVIGQIEGNPKHELFNIAGALRLRNGYIVILNQGDLSVRFYSADGKFLRSVGRRGAGPGEYGGMTGIMRYRGDSIAIHDYNMARVTVLSADGVTGRVQLMPLAPGYAATNTIDDSVFVTWRVFDRDQYRQGTDVYWDSTYIFRFHGTSTAGLPVIDTIGQFPLTQHVEMPGRQTSDWRLHPWAPHLRVAVRGDRLVLGTGERYQIEERTRAGKVIRIIRRAHEPERGTEERIAAFKQHFLAARQRNRDPYAPLNADARTRAMLDRALYAETLPAYSQLIVDELGNIWAENYRYATEPNSIWSVFDSMGVWLGEVAIPSGFRAAQIGTDWILGYGLTDMGVEQVRLYALDK